MSDQPGNPTEPQIGTVHDADTSQVDDVIAQVAAEHEEAPENPSVAEQSTGDKDVDKAEKAAQKEADKAAKEAAKEGQGPERGQTEGRVKT
jgi:hypothetical protein